MPQSVEAEQSVLGALMIDPDAFDRVRRIVSAADFAVAGHALIFDAIAELRRERQSADVVSVLDRLTVAAPGRVAAEFEGGAPAYLHALAVSVPTSAHVERHARIVADKARLRALSAAAERVAAVALRAKEPAELQPLVGDLVEGLRRAALADARRVLPAALSIADLEHAEIERQSWWWDLLVPAGHVTLLSAHGGTGKSTLALQLLASMAIGAPFLGHGTRRARCLFFSAEDPSSLVRMRLRRVCRDLGVDPASLADNLRVIDASDVDAALYVEQRIGGVRHGATTPAYEELRAYVAEHAIDVVVIDNASDTFDADEIARSLVRGFIRALSMLVRERGGAVVLLAHVDKGTSRAGKGALGEAYSGSTAWHNGPRSRLVLVERGKGDLELRHEKSNLGPRQEPIALVWPEGGLPRLAPAEVFEADARPDAASAMRRLVGLVADFNRRGESISTSLRAGNSAPKLLGADARYPRHLRPAQVEQLMREAERAGYLEREAYTGAHRKRYERWRATDAGCGFAENLPLFGGGQP